MRGEKRLSARQVQTLGAGYHADGAGLYLQVTKAGNRSWIFRFQLNGKRREMGLGPVSVIGLADARQRAQQARLMVLDGLDPIEAKGRRQDAQGTTWGECADALIETLRVGWKGPAQEQQWRQSLADHGPDRDMLAKAVTTATAHACLSRIWTDKTETATRLRARCERVWDFARVSGVVEGQNPFRWKGHLDKMLAAPRKVTKPKHFAAMPYSDLPAFMGKLRSRQSLGRLALQFTILTAARTGEVIGATWDEFDLEAGVWTRPGERMKAGNDHLIPLSRDALAILSGLPRKQNPFPLSENTMLYLLQRQPPKGLGQPYTVHGFRSSFSDWAHETTGYPNHVIEMALAHTIKDKAEAAYRRGALLDKRRELMEDWARFCG